MILSLLLLGCGTAPGDPLMLAWRSELFSETHGLQLDWDGRTGHAGMRDMTCEVATLTGGTGREWDLPGPDDRVLDGWHDPSMGFTTVTRGILGPWVACPGEAEPEIADIGDPEVEHARLVRGGLVLIAEREGDCVATWSGFDGTAQNALAVPGGVCERRTRLSVDRQGAELFAVTRSRVIHLTRDSWSELELQADDVAWDAVSGVLYAAHQDRIVAWEPDGRRRWSVRTEGQVLDVSDLGDRGAAVAIVDPGAGPGMLLVLDGETGAVRLDTTTPEPARELETSGNGSVLALLRDEAVLFVDVLDVATPRR